MPPPPPGRAGPGGTRWDPVGGQSSALAPPHVPPRPESSPRLSTRRRLRRRPLRRRRPHRGLSPHRGSTPAACTPPRGPPGPGRVGSQSCPVSVPDPVSVPVPVPVQYGPARPGHARQDPLMAPSARPPGMRALLLLLLPPLLGAGPGARPPRCVRPRPPTPRPLSLGGAGRTWLRWGGCPGKGRLCGGARGGAEPGRESAGCRVPSVQSWVRGGSRTSSEEPTLSLAPAWFPRVFARGPRRSQAERTAVRCGPRDCCFRRGALGMQTEAVPGD